MAKRIPMMIDADVREVDAATPLSKLVPGGANSIVTGGGRIIPSSDFARYRAADVPEGFDTQTATINKASDRAGLYESPKPFIKIVSLMTARNPEVVAEMSPAEQARVAMEAGMFFALGALMFVQWSALIGSGGALYGVVGAVVFTTLFLGLDYTMGAAIEREAAAGRLTWRAWSGIVARVAISAVGAIVLSTAFTLKQFSPQIDARNRADLAAANAPLREEYATRLASLRARTLAPLEADIKTARAERERNLTAISGYQSEAFKQAAAAAEQLREAERQREGVLGAYKGEGPLYRFATRQKQAADEAVARAEQIVERERKTAAALDARLLELERQRREAASGISRVERELEQKLSADPRYIVGGTDFLSRFRGLLKLTHDPVDGGAVKWILAACFALFVVLDCAYLFAKASLAGLTYGRRDALRELRDLERWAQTLRTQMREDEGAFRRACNDEAHRARPGAEGSDAKVVVLHPQRPLCDPAGD